MFTRITGRVISVSDSYAGSSLNGAVSASDTELIVDDLSFFDEDGGSLTIDDGDNSETVEYTGVDDDTDTITLAAGLANSYADDADVFIYPLFTIRYAEIQEVGSEGETLQAVVPRQVAIVLPEGTREDDEREQVGVVFNKPSSTWLVRDVFNNADSPFATDEIVDALSEMLALNDLVDVDTTGVVDGDALVYDSYTMTWLPVTITAGGSALEVLEATVSRDAAVESIDFGHGLDAVETTDHDIQVDVDESELSHDLLGSVSADDHHTENHDHDGTPTQKLLQANTHETPDTDTGTSSLHHTIGTGATQAAAGNHTHAGSGLIVQEGDSDVDTNVTTMDFDASDFNISSSPAGEANVSLNYGTGAGQPAEGNHTHAATPLTVQEGDADVDTAVTVLDFDASDFNVSSSPSGEANVSLAYGSSAGTPAEGNHTHTAYLVAEFSQSGTLSVGTGKFRWYNDTGKTLTFVAARGSVDTQPTGAAIRIDVNKNGTTVFTTQTNRINIAVSTNTHKATTFDVTTVADGDYLTVDIDIVGSTIAGADLSVLVWMSYSL